MILTERLVIRVLTEHDVTEKYVAWLNDPEINRFLEVKHQVDDLESCLRFVSSMNDSRTENLFGIFVNDEHIGNIKLGLINWVHQYGELSFFIGEKQSWGKGFITEAIAAVCSYGFNELGLVKIAAGCYAENLSSLRVLTKSGFEIEGLLKQHVNFEGSRQDVYKLGLLKN
jgi:ribosomal-protein-alanine N-acetyltransferase